MFRMRSDRPQGYAGCALRERLPSVSEGAVINTDFGVEGTQELVGDAITGTSVESKDLSSLLEIVRFKYEFDAGDQSTDGAHFLMMVPSWRPY